MITSNLKKLIIPIVILVLASVVSAAWQEPTASPTGGNRNAPLTTLSDSQWRTNALAIGTSGAPLTNYMLDVDGFIRVAGTGALAAIFGDSNIEGTLKSDTLAHSVTEKEVCVNSSGELSLCTTSQTNKTVVIDDTPGGAEQFTVPTGVTEITVEIWGAGGGGYYYQNTNTGVSHDCTSESLDRHGKATTFVSTLGSSSLDLEAEGGECGYVVSSSQGDQSVGGQGGSFSSSGSMIQSGTKIEELGENGSIGGGGNNYAPLPGGCGSSSILVLGGKGGNGGAGGRSGYGGVAYTPIGGNYSLEGIDPINCEPDNANIGYITPPYPADVPIPTHPGVGGSGAAGQGGNSIYSDTTFFVSDCSFNNCNGGAGYSGGGGGAYVKVVLNVNPGDTFNYNVGAAYQSSSAYGTGGYITCSSGVWKFNFNCGAHSGYGSHGQVRITY